MVYLIMKKNLLIVAFFSFLFSWGQNQENRTDISNTKELKKLAELAEQKYKADSAKIADFVKNNPSVQYRYKANDVTYEIVDIVNDKPVYRSTDNLPASQATKTNALQVGGNLGLNLTGNNMAIGVWDGGHVLKTHVEFQMNGSSRVLTPDTSLPNPSSDGHGTHVAGTIGASGINSAAKGMATEATILSYNWSNDLAEVINEVSSADFFISNHSYGVPVLNDEGNPNVPSWVMGCYSSQAVEWDQVAYNAPYYLMVASAGNSGAEEYTGGLMSGYDKLTYEKNAKNNLVIANANPFVNSGGVLINTVINGSSSQGPSDDGRVKPDIAGDGTNVFSTYNTNDSSYQTTSGTSMASPNVAGSLLLLQEYYHQLHGGYMRAATLKGLVCHNVLDPGTPGPDAKFGWGLLDARESALTLSNSIGSSKTTIVDELILNQGETYSFEVVVNSPAKLKATICWTDVPGTAKNNQLNSSSPALVNDLDIRIIKDTEINFPWKLQLSDVSAAAIKGDNTVDNVEKVEVDNAVGTYTVQITHKGTLSGGNQAYSLIVSGFDQSLSTESFTTNNLFVYPNPTSDRLYFNTTVDISLDKVEIYDTIGKRILTSQINNNSVDISQLTSGVYFVKIYSGESQVTKKIIKK